MDAKAIYNANRAYKNTENNIRCAVNAVRNRVVPDAYKINSTMVTIRQGKNYPANNNPRAMLDALRVRYGKATRTKKRDNKRNWSAPW